MRKKTKNTAIESRRPFYIDILYITVMMLSLLFYVISSSLVIEGDLSSFEIMVSGLIFFSMFIFSTYILFTKIKVNTFVFLGSFFIWVYMVFYNLSMTILHKIGMALIIFGILLETLNIILTICGKKLKISIKLDALKNKNE